MQKIRIEGPYYGSYSLSAVNRHLAQALSKLSDIEVSISATCAENWHRDTETEIELETKYGILYRDVRDENYAPDVVIRNSWPITHNFLHANSLKIRWFAWEESLVPNEIIKGFDKNYDLVAVKSKFVKNSLLNSGLNKQIVIIPDACVLPTHFTDPPSSEITTFLHVSSCFPRKSPDVLIEAFLQAFNNSPNVKLIIKTFPNPHNNVIQIINEAQKHTQSNAKIDLIEEDISEEELVNLINKSHFMVFPSRGEGFGLPVAEAHAIGRPAIIPRSSALEELFLEGIDYEIEYTPAYAQTHLTEPSSLWYEPSVNSLKEQLISGYTDLKNGEYNKRIIKLRNLGNQHTWIRSADNLIKILNNQTSPIEKNKIEKILIISSFNQVCGISDYLSYLIENYPIAEQPCVEITIFAPILDGQKEGDVEIIEHPLLNKIKLIRVWFYWGDVFTSIMRYVPSIDYHRVIIQHHTGFFSPNQLGMLVKFFNESKKPVFTTFHSLFQEDIPPDQGNYINIINNNKENTSKFFVHSLREYLSVYSNSSVYLLPQGYIKSKGYSELRPSGNSLIACSFGFLRRHKGIRELLAAWREVINQIPNAKLLLLCSKHPASDSAEEEKECIQLIDKYGLGGSVTLDTSHHEMDVVEAVLGYCDLSIFPYLPINEGSSAAVRVAISANAAIICSENELFDEFSNAVLRTTLDVNDMSKNIIKLLTDRPLREEYRKKAKHLEASLSWDKISNRYWSIILRNDLVN